MKFGGSSVADAQRIESVAGIVAETAAVSPPCVVLSALKGITDLLIDAASKATASDAGYRDRLDELEQRHLDVASTLIGRDAPVCGVLSERVADLRGVLHGVELVRECTARTRDLIMSFGELLSSELVTAILHHKGVTAVMADPRGIIVTDEAHGSARVNRPTTYERMRTHIAGQAGVVVIPGFVAATPSGVTTTLGRNGSDYTASLVGAGLGAECVEIWTDVDGVYSADPRSVPDAFVIEKMSFEEAAELSYFGAEVLHPSSMVPVVELDIPVYIRNTLNPAAKGTRISAESSQAEFITGLASVEHVSIVNVEGAGMMGTPGIAARIFTAIAHAGVNVLMISQASSEHTICLVFRSGDVPRAIAELEREFAPELASREIHQFETYNELEIVAVIGENMRGKSGVSGRLFQSLGAEGISVHAIAQGSSERNISFVVAGSDRERTLNTVHRAFFSK
ncbi:MAG: aspartate kinase [bacterium]